MIVRINAIAPATTGYASASVMSAATRPSSSRLTTTFDAGSGDTFTRSRVDALAPCAVNASAPPTSASTIVDVDRSLLENSHAPASGRMNVCTASHVLSTYEILSTISSTTNIANAAAITHGFCRNAGLSTQSRRPPMPSTENTRYIEMPDDQELAIAVPRSTPLQRRPPQLCRDATVQAVRLPQVWPM